MRDRLPRTAAWLNVRGAALLLLLAGASVFAQHADHGAHNGMQVTPAGVVMNQNRDRLPNGCRRIGEDIAITVHAGRRYAADRPGQIFGMSQHDVQVPPCARVTITLVNEDEVRHQWMVHGLPKYLYPAGMFHLEAMGGQSMSGTFVAPAEDRNYLVHCDMAQHMEKGMRGQLVVGRGNGDLWAVPGISDAFRRASYLPKGSAWWLALLALLAAALLLARRS